MTRALHPCHLLLPLVFIASATSTLMAEGKFDLTPAQETRIKKFLPRSFPKLTKRDPVSVLIIGDDVAAMKVYNADDGNTLKSFAGNLVGIIADQYFYAGGVRMVRPPKGMPEKSIEIKGPEISVRNVSRPGRLLIHGLCELSAMTPAEFPNIVIVNFGVNDALEHYSLVSYRRALQEMINLTRQQNADIILLGPTLIMTEPVEQGLALTRAYADIMREVAEKNQVFFADLGDIAWLSRVDERMKGLEGSVEKKKSDASKATANSTAPGPIIKIPKPDELDPDPEKRAARLFRQVSTDLLKWFDHGKISDLVHPNSELHRFLARRTYAELLDGPRKVPWSISSAQAIFKKPNECEVSYRVENTTDAPLRITALPLVTLGWKPQEAVTQVDLQPAQKGLVTVTYRRTESLDAIAPGESVLRLPVLVLGNSWSRIEDLHAVIQPFSVQWNTGAQFNVENEFTINATVTNPGASPLNGTWEGQWQGQKLGGKFSAPARGQSPIALLFKLPASSSTAPRQKGTLNFTVTASGLALPFNREIEIAQNIGLKQVVTLQPRGSYFSDKPGLPTVPGPSQPGVTFRADADPSALYLTWDIFGINLMDNPKGSAAVADLHLDARSYGKRLNPGATGPLRVSTKAADGDGTLAPVMPWAFGTGYGSQRFDAATAGARLTSRPDGSRRFTLMIPRNSFTLHEWALGNGNSQLGISTSLGIWQKPDEKNPSGSYMNYTLIENGLHQDDAESLAALELTEQPTKRWTVRLY